MHLSINIVLLGLLLTLAFPVHAQQAGISTSADRSNTTHRNPVLNIDFPDPTVINVNGTYYAYATQAVHNGKMVNIQVASSTDLFNWKYEGDALPQKPVWANKTQDFWAPHVLYDSTLKKYVLFFCAKSNDTTIDKCIGVAYANKPTGPFIDKGTPLLGDKGFVDLDPMALVDPQTGKKVLFWGSGFSPIKAQELNNNWSAFKEGSSAVNVMYPGKESNYTKLIEGAWIDVYNGKYYLYYSGDNCCGAGANYAVMIARADSIFGPYTRLAEAKDSSSSAILAKDSTWLAPGHNSIFKDDRGNRYIAYHAIWRDEQKAENPIGKDHYIKRVLCIEPVQYIDGWPVIIHAF